MPTSVARKPLNIVYGVDENPPLGVTVVSALQHVGLISIFLLFPLLVCREAQLSPDKILDVLSLSMLAMGAGAILPALARGPVGSGYLCPSIFTVAYLGPSLLALKAGGLSLVFGMTVFAGCVEAALSRLLRHLRALFPSEIAGLVVVLLGVTIGAIGIRYVLGADIPQAASGRELAVAAISLGAMVALNVWTGGFFRMFCALLGMIVGYAAAALLGILTESDMQKVMDAPLVSVPSLGHLGWSFDFALIGAFAVGALAACLKTIGNVTTCQKMNDAEWVRPDMHSISKGVLADGLGTVTAGILGTVGVNSSPSAVGLAGATGVTSRRVAYGIGAIFFALAFLPKVASVLSIIPRPVMGAALVFSACFVFVNGVQIITSRLLDARRTFVIGLAFLSGIAVDLLPGYFANVPAQFQPLVSSSLVVGMLTAVLLNLVFRLGVRQTQRLHVNPKAVDLAEIEAFMEARGAAWGARRDVIDRASFNLQQSIETIAEGCDPQGPLEITASFDEFNLDVRMSYAGVPLELPDKRPSNEEIMASEEGQRKLAGFMLRRYADRVAATHKAGRSTILFHFDH
jgi:NCS2 family nucleobase:cation symporter-2